MFLSYEQLELPPGEVKTASDISIPAGATLVMLQASGNNVRYIMDNVENPNSDYGMLLLTTNQPEQFGIEDLLRGKFTSDAATNAYLNLHFYAGRAI